MFQVTLQNNEYQKRLDEERYIGLIEPLDMPYVLFINMDYLLKRVGGAQIDVPFFAYLYGVGKSKMQPTDGSIPATPVIVWGVYTFDGKIEYADMCRYQTRFLSKIVESLINSGYQNVGSMVIDRISVRIREYLGVKAGETDQTTQMVAAAGVFGSATMETPKFISSQSVYEDVKRYFAVADGKLTGTEDQLEQWSDTVDTLLKDAFHIDSINLEEELQMEEYYQQLREDLKRYEQTTNMSYNPHKMKTEDILKPLIDEINRKFEKDVSVYRPHRQQGVEACPAYDECMKGLLSDYCAIYNPKLYEEGRMLI